nr:PREDICTED: inositol-trisphosphate 3-kinase A-like [Lepisosteus oculatus]
MSDVLRPFVPQYRGPTTRGGQTYLRLEDLLSGLDSPVIMDCKMGVSSCPSETALPVDTVIHCHWISPERLHILGAGVSVDK